MVCFAKKDNNIQNFVAQEQIGTTTINVPCYQSTSTSYSTSIFGWRETKGY